MNRSTSKFDSASVSAVILWYRLGAPAEPPFSRRFSVALPARTAHRFAPRSALVRQQRQHGVVAQLVVVDHVLVSQGDAGDVLAHQRPHRVLDAARVPVVVEAGGDLVEEPFHLGRLAQQGQV